MDGVLADVEKHIIYHYERLYGVSIPYASIVGKSEEQAFPISGAVGEIVRAPGFFRSIPLIPGAIEALTELVKDYEVFIVSAAVEFPTSLNEKLEWLAWHFPFISWRNIVFCGDKSIIKADIMVDDHFKNLDHFDGKPILFHAAHNAATDRHHRVHNWKEALAYIRLLDTEK